MKNKIYSLLIFILLISCDENKESEIPGFIDIINGNTTITDDKITSQITVKTLPTQLTFSNNDLNTDALEYKWAVNFDIDHNNEDDYQFAISNFKSSDVQDTGKIIENTQHNAWVLKNGEGGTYLVPITASINGNILTLETDINESNELRNIPPNASISYSTYYYDGKNKYEDSYE